MKKLMLFAVLFSAVSCHSAQKCVEKQKPDCICTMQYDPVCGCNNKTYGNACSAKCAGITKYTPGECPVQATANLEGNVWRLRTFSVDPAPVAVPDDVVITLQFNNGTVKGNGGCNNIGGTYILKEEALTMSGIYSTKMFCEKAAKWENMFLERLAKSQTYNLNAELLEIHCGELGNLIFDLNK